MHRLKHALAALLVGAIMLAGQVKAQPNDDSYGPGPPVGGGSGLTVGGAIKGTCPIGYAIYNNGGFVGCEASGTAAGTVTSASVVSANGFAGTVATPTSTPAITITTSVSGVAKGNGTGLVPAVAGTDYIAPGTDLPLAGGTLTGELITAAAAAGGAGFNLPPGSAPTSPVNGDVWTTSAGMYVRIAGATVGPLGTGGSSGLVVNSTGITGGAANKVLIDNGTTLEELTYGLTGNSVIVETTSSGLLTASILPLGTNSTAGAVKGDGSTVSVVTGTASTIITDTTTAGSISSWNIGGQNTMSASGTATLPTLTIGQSFLLVTGSGATATLSVPGGVTLANAVSQSTLGPLSFLACAYNSATVYDCITASNFMTLSQITGFGANVATALADAANATGGFGTVGTSGSNVGLLNANKTDSGNNTYSGATQTYSAIPSGTIASGKNLGLNSSNQLVASTVSGGSGGGGTFNYSDNGVTLSGTAYVPIGGGGAPSATEANVDVGAPSALTVANLQVGLSAAPGVGNSVQVTLRDNAASQAVTCTISGSSATSCSDLTHSFNVAQSDLIDWQIVTTGSIIGTPTITITANNGTSNVGVTSVVCGTGLSGGTITTTGTCALANTAVTAGSYTNLNATINAQGQITAASNGSGGSSCPTGFTASNGVCVWTQTANGTATNLAWTGLTGNEYEMRCSGIIAGNATNLFFFQFGEGGTPTWEVTGYNYGGVYQGNGGGPALAQSTNQAGMMDAGDVLSTGTMGFSTTVNFHGLQGSANKSFDGISFIPQGSGSNLYSTFESGYYSSDANVITAIRFIDTDSHNIASGYCSLIFKGY